MAKRPDISIILLFNRQIVRADFSTRSLGQDHIHPAFFLLESVDVESSLGDSVEQIISGHPPLGPRTVVLSSDVWSQVVSLPKLSVAGIEPAELDSILSFEAETLSGIDIDDICLASSPLGTKDDQQQYWVSAIRQSDLDAVNRLLESVGCRDIAVAHPAGFSGNPQTSPAGDSAEVWDNLVFHLNNHATKLSAVKHLAADQFANDIPVLLASSSNEELPRNSNVTEIGTEESLVLLASQIATNFVQRSSELVAPQIRLIKGSRGTPVRHLLTGVIALAVVGFCFWHWQYVNQNNKLILKRIEEVKIPAQAKKTYDAQFISILEQRAVVESEDSALGDDLKRVRFFLDNQIDRIAKLLTLLIELRTTDLVIEKIGGTEDGVSISGTSLNGEAAQALAKRLRERAMPLGWVVNPASQEGLQKLTTGGPWKYEIRLTDTGPFEMAVQPRKKPTTALKSKP